MSKSATILGLVALASASVPAYGSSAAAYGSSAAAYGSSSYDPVVSSAAPYQSSSWADGVSSSAIAYPSGSASWGPISSSAVVYPSGSVSWAPVSSSVVPSATPTPSCWAKCFEEAGISSEADLCGNVEVDKCIHDGCCKDEAWAYWQWYDGYCGVPSSSYVIPSSTYPVGPASSSYPASATPTVECWGKCFAENGITSESELCGNTAVDACISETCDCEEDKAYWVWYESYCTASPSSSSASPTSPTVPTSTPEDCWGTCFEEAGIASESELCGNTAVDACIHDTCSPAEDKAYWAWYLSYCPAPSAPVTTPCVTPTAPSSTPSSPVDTCWTDCFAQYDVTSEAALCGNDDVSKCIHDTCAAALDKAYWDWYNGYCAPVTTGVPSGSTSWAPVYSSPATGVPVPPPAPAPYSSYPVYSSPVSPASGVAQPTGYAAPSASAWSPVPATGAGAVTKPGVLLAAAMAVAALL